MKLNEETALQALDTIYDHVMNGLPGSESVYDLAEKYIQTYHHSKFAVDSLIRWQTTKCATAGFFTGLGGILALPVAVPADLVTTYYIQMRMIAAVAHINGYDIKSEQVKTFVFCSLLGDGVHEALKKAGLRTGKQLSKKAITSMSRDILLKVNRSVGKKLVAKFGGKSMFNLSKIIPIAGGILGAGVNGYFCYEIGKAAQLLFPESEDYYSIAS